MNPIVPQSPYRTHANAMAAQQALLAGSDTGCPTFNWDDQDWQILPSSAVLKKNLGAGGFGLDFDLRFSTTVAQFLSRDMFPDVNTLVSAMLETSMSYLGADYKIKSVHVQAGALTLMIEANSLNQT